MCQFIPASRNYIRFFGERKRRRPARQSIRSMFGAMPAVCGTAAASVFQALIRIFLFSICFYTLFDAANRAEIAFLPSRRRPSPRYLTANSTASRNRANGLISPIKKKQRRFAAPCRCHPKCYALTLKKFIQHIQHATCERRQNHFVSISDCPQYAFMPVMSPSSLNVINSIT